MNWVKHTTLTYGQMTINLASIDIIGMGRYRKYIIEGRDWFEKAYGLSIDDIPADDNLLSESATVALYRAKMLASVDSVYVNDERVDMPIEWDDVGTFARSFPPAFFNQWQVESDRINVELFSTEPDPNVEGQAESLPSEA